MSESNTEHQAPERGNCKSWMIARMHTPHDAHQRTPTDVPMSRYPANRLPLPDTIACADALCAQSLARQLVLYAPPRVAIGLIHDVIKGTHAACLHDPLWTQEGLRRRQGGDE